LEAVRSQPVVSGLTGVLISARWGCRQYYVQMRHVCVKHHESAGVPFIDALLSGLPTPLPQASAPRGERRRVIDKRRHAEPESIHR
jgi:hypothetical protein